MVKVRDKLIPTRIPVILEKIRRDTRGDFLKDIREEKKGNIMVTCPFHGDHKENRPSCGIGTEGEKEGIYHCFTCGASGFITSFIGKCFDRDNIWGEEWLLENFGQINVEYEEFLTPIELNKPKKKKYLDPKILEEYNFKHPYMYERGLTDFVIDKFKIGYNPKTESLTFPIWDSHGGLVGITERSVNTKHFHIPEGLDKPIYLLNFILRENIDTVWVVESQINALNCWAKGRPAIALLGTGSEEQYEILRKSGIIVYFLAFDGDEAGDNGRRKFIKNVKRSHTIMNVVQIPRGKDVADLSLEEFNNLKYFTV